MITFNSIEEALEDFRAGKVLIVVDNEDRENEGDFICAAETITSDIVNFMSLQGRGLLCAPLEEKRADELQLPLMVRNNTSLHETAFTVSVDLIGNGCTTGISTQDRCLTLRALADSDFKANDFARPGHIFPLRAKSGGVLQRAGHTEAVIDLAKLSGMKPAGALIEILNDDGTMARLPQLQEKAQKFGLKIISIHDLVEYRLRSERLVINEKSIKTKIKGQEFTMHQFGQLHSSATHLAFVKGDPSPDRPCCVRVQHADTFAELTDYIVHAGESSLAKAFDIISNHRDAVFLLLSQTEDRTNPLKKFEEQSTIDIYRSDQTQREIGIGSQILKELGVGQMIVISNHPRKTIGIEPFGLEIIDYIPLD